MGTGASATVHRALCNPLNEVVAINILYFERSNCDLVKPPPSLMNIYACRCQVKFTLIEDVFRFYLLETSVLILLTKNGI